ncbi:hypothetical protein HNQ86_001326 [Oleiagrimonas soli]|uniref:Uncharacterized protein n=1 Tax=Oleiagrimonas soli TaxID=1543381 RepID=A0A841KMV4_9GAMM|nr:hypothetical protein [Oleiagrimonas soli]
MIDEAIQTLKSQSKADVVLLDHLALPQANRRALLFTYNIKRSNNSLPVTLLIYAAVTNTLSLLTHNTPEQQRRQQIQHEPSH